MSVTGADDLRDPKLLFRKLEALYDRAAAEGDGSASLPAFADGFFAAFAAELGLASLRLFVERRSRFACVHAVGEAREEHELERARVLLEFPPGERVFVHAGPDAPRAGILLEDERRVHLLVFRLREGAVPSRLLFVLSTVSAALTARLLRDRLRDTLRAAVEIQQSLLPAEPPSFAGFDVAARSVPAEEVGGDFYDFIPFGPSTLGVALGDASGHGLPAALVVRDVVVGLRMGLEKEMKAGYILSKLNRVIHKSSLSSSFVSLFYGELEDNGSFFYYNAGHEPPILFQGGREVELARGGAVIGPLADARFKRHFAHVDRGATLVLYTDGIVERRSSSESFFGVEGLVKSVRARLGASAAEIRDGVFEDARHFGGDARWEDDATLVVVTRER